MDDLMRLNMIEQARLVRDGEVSAAEMVEAAISAIEKINPDLNAVVLPLFDMARKATEELTGKEPFAGVPILLKDVFAEYAGAPITECSRFLRGYVSPRDSELVARYRRAGLIVVGRTNSPEFASKPTTEPELYGATLNPWDKTRSPGGSSGGAGAAVASGMVAVAHANDGGGSTRIPAGNCGLVGLKPTRGRNPLGPDYGDVGASGLLCEHVVTRTVMDNAAVLDMTGGPDRGAPFYPPTPARPYVEEVGADPGRLRIAFSTDPIVPTDVHPDCKQAALEAAALCEDLGHHVEEAKPQADGERFSAFFTSIWVAMVAWMIRDWSRRTGVTPTKELFELHTWKMFEVDSKRRPSDLLLAIQDMHSFAREVAPFFDMYDLWLTPTMIQPPVPIGYFDFNPDAPRQSTERMETIPRFTAPANATGQPGISLPLYWNNDNLPIGVHLMGRYADEATLFRLAAQLEAARPWAHRWPS